ncbi:MAG TPA: hypothetical protein VKQ72_11775 [Aggregatilineales bacterium]|nr:hypothetical protein [Aggregatilineales bacterium]
MDISKQLQEAIKTMTDSEKRVLEVVTKAVTDIATPPSTNPWEFSVDLWEKGVKGFLTTQQDWTALLLRGVGAATTKVDTTGEWSERLGELTKLTLEYQTKIWEAWFAILKQIDPVKNATILKEIKPLTESWSENVRRAIQLQEEWLQSALKFQNDTPAPAKQTIKPQKDGVKAQKETA